MKTKLNAKNGKWQIVAIGCMRNCTLHGETHDPLSVNEVEHDLRLARAIWCYGYAPALVAEVIQGQIDRLTAGTPDQFLDTPGLIPEHDALEQLEAWKQFQTIFARIRGQFAFIVQEIQAQRIANARKSRKHARQRKAAAKRMAAIELILSRRYTGMGFPTPSRETRVSGVSRIPACASAGVSAN